MICSIAHLLGAQQIRTATRPDQTTPERPWLAPQAQKETLNSPLWNGSMSGLIGFRLGVRGLGPSTQVHPLETQIGYGRSQPETNPRPALTKNVKLGAVKSRAPRQIIPFCQLLVSALAAMRVQTLSSPSFSTLDDGQARPFSGEIVPAAWPSPSA